MDYTANGDEVFITVANFSRNDVTGNTGISRRNQFLVFVDNISLTPLDAGERLCANWKEEKEEIYAQNERHQYLERVIKQRAKELQETQLMPTMTAGSDTLIISDVLFATAKKELRSTVLPVLDSFCRSVQGRLIDSLVIEGHTDNTGTIAFNDQLSLGRATSVANYLKSCASFVKIPVLIRGWGNRRPIAPNDSQGNRQKNRRVEMVVYFRE